MFTVEFILILCILGPTLAINLKIDGIIDLGPGWNYMYRIYDAGPTEAKLNKSMDILKNKQSNIGPLKVTSYKLQHHEHEIFTKDVKKDRFYSQRHKNHNKRIQADKHKLHAISGGANKDETFEEKEFLRHINNTLDRMIKNTDFQQEHYKNKRTLKLRTPEYQERGITAINYSMKYKNNLFIKQHKIKDDSVADGFITHIYKQSLKIFDTINYKLDGISKSTIETLKREFKKKFGKFVKESREHLIRTESGIRRLIFNAIDIANRILKRLISLLTTQQHAKIFQTELVKQKEIEYRHLCSKLGICRTSTMFSDFLIDSITIILSTDGDKITQSLNAFTEALKNNDFSNTLDESTQSKFRMFLAKLEMLPLFFVKAVYEILRAVLIYKDRSILVGDDVDANASNKTVIFRELIGLIDENITKVSNESQWKNIKRALTDWADGKMKDILKIAESFVKSLNEALNKMSKEVSTNINNFLKMLLVNNK